MTGQDAETYLRLRAEDELREQDGTVLARARTLVAVGALPLAVAEQVSEQFRRARELRGIDGMRDGHPLAPAGGGPVRVVALDRVVEQPWGVVSARYAIFRPDRTTIAAKVTGNGASAGPVPSAPGRRRPATPSLSHWPPPLVIGDGSVTRSTNFSGGGSDDEVSGKYVAAPGLPMTTQVLTLFGERIELAESSGARVEVRSAARDEPVPRHLEHLAAIDRGHQGLFWGSHGPAGGALDVAIDTLIGVGLLDVGDVRIDRALAARDACVSAGSRPRPGPRRRPGPRTDAPERADRSFTVGAATPVFDGISVVFALLEPDGDGFSVDVEMDGPVALWGEVRLGERLLSFTATDDVGTRYLGSVGSSSGGSDGAEASIHFSPALDPRATHLELCVSTGSADAVVRIDLPAAPGTPR